MIKDGRTALHIAADNSNLKIMSQLIERNADMTAIDKVHILFVYLYVP
jgi:ankyrin repeat protein